MRENPFYKPLKLFEAVLQILALALSMLVLNEMVINTQAGLPKELCIDLNTPKDQHDEPSGDIRDPAGAGITPR